MKETNFYGFIISSCPNPQKGLEDRHILNLILILSILLVSKNKKEICRLKLNP